MQQQLAAWGARHPRVTDAVITLFLLIVAIAAALSLHDTPDRVVGATNWGLVVSTAIITFWRRTRPLTALVAGTITTAITWSTGLPNVAFEVALLMFSAVLYGPQTTFTRRLVTVCSGGLSVFTLIGVLVADVPIYVVPLVAATFTLAAFAAMSVLNARAEVEQADQRAKYVERHREHEARHAIAEERARIARELHDVVAHGLSVIVVQAGAAQRILDTDTDGTRHALGQIESAARDSLNEMRQVLGVLRTSDSEARRPASGIDALEELIGTCRERGLNAELWLSGDRRPLPATVETGVFRIVQEALTNVLKHGGTNVNATVNLHFGDEFVHLTVVDDGRGAASVVNSDGQGHGLIGMRERVEVLDGTIHVGPIIGGGFEIDVTLPLTTGSRVGVAAPEIADDD